MYCTGGFKQPRCLLTGLGRARQAIDIDPHGAGPLQQPRQRFSGGTGGEHVIDYRQVLAMQRLFVRQGKCLAKIPAAGDGVQLLLGRRVLDALRQIIANRDLQRGAQPVGHHSRLVEPALAQPLACQRYCQKSRGPRQSFIERMLQVTREMFGEQPPERPARLVLEARDQTVHRKGEAPRNGDMIEGRWALEALATDHPAYRQRQCADLAMTAKPRKVGLATRAQRLALLAAVIAKLAILFSN